MIIIFISDNITFNHLKLYPDGDKQYEGLLKYYWNFKWRTVCSTNMTEDDINFICKEMGYDEGISTPK